MNTRAIPAAATSDALSPTQLWHKPPAALFAAVSALAAIAIQSLWLPIDADVSWLITVCERVLADDRLYVDILEVNPPASVWMYMPLVWLADVIGAKPEAVVAGAFVAGGLASVFATIRLGARLDHAPTPALLAAVLSAILLVLPMALFAQREHAALLLAFPALTALALVAEGKPMAKRTLCAAGFAAGLIIVIKPYFVLAVVAPAIWAAVKRRSLVPLWPGIAAASFAIALYAAALAAFARDYLDYLPVIARTYGRMHEEYWKVAIGPALYPAICVGLALLLRAPRLPSISVAWALGAAGFLVGAYVQAKNYPNHWLPQAALALAAACAMLSLPRIANLRRVAVGAGLAAVAVGLMHHWAIRPDPAVDAAIRQVAPPQPKMIALSPQLITGHPVTRNVGGKWVGSRAGLFTASGARFVGLDDPVALSSYQEDISSFAKDVARHSPDVVLVDLETKEALMAKQEIARAMSGYRLSVRPSETTEVWVRRAPQR